VGGCIANQIIGGTHICIRGAACIIAVIASESLHYSAVGL
jgi:hypothetical protein